MRSVVSPAMVSAIRRSIIKEYLLISSSRTGLFTAHQSEQSWQVFGRLLAASRARDTHRCLREQGCSSSDLGPGIRTSQYTCHVSGYGRYRHAAHRKSKNIGATSQITERMSDPSTFVVESFRGEQD